MAKSRGLRYLLLRNCSYFLMFIIELIIFKIHNATYISLEGCKRNWCYCLLLGGGWQAAGVKGKLFTLYLNVFWILNMCLYYFVENK